jgi:ATP-dependent DNA helicase DinG
VIPQYLEKVAKKLPGFEVRPEQLQMFQDVFAAYDEECTYLIEAGTGTGKSLAYLIPAILWAAGKKEPSVIATHTIALQEQLMQKDIPFLLDALDLDLKAVLAKGMHNYVCLRKLHDNDEEIPESILNWSKTCREGSKSELPVLPSADLWEQINAESESCTHAKCPYYKDCFFFKARKAMEDAHLIVANHHLLFADLAIREESETLEAGAILPKYKRLILDEAHHCEDVATQYFADHVSRRGIIHALGRLFSDRGTGKLISLCRKINEVYPESNPLTESLIIIFPAEKRAIVDKLNLAFDALSNYFASHRLEDKCRIREIHLNDPFWIQQVQPPVETVCADVKRFIHSILLIEGKIKQMQDDSLETKCEGLLAEIKGICKRLETFFSTLHTFVFSPLNPTVVRWMEGKPPDLHLVAADLEIANRLAAALFNRLPTIVLCSATLSTHASFSFIRERLGIQNAQERIYKSPFDYKQQSLLTVPLDLPDPSHPSFTRLAAEQIWETISISQGGVFVLFTSYSMLRECEQLLAPRLYQKHFSLHCQGDESRMHLLRKFRESAKGVLFGTDSFWEGVDVAGEALRCVIIVKLPFKVPSDPLFQARSEAISKMGGSPFFDYSLPHAIVKFKQGFGRLIRTKNDRGCIICLDPRLATKGYGKMFLKSLPDCPTHFETSQQIHSRLRDFFKTRHLA